MFISLLTQERKARDEGLLNYGGHYSPPSAKLEVKNNGTVTWHESKEVTTREAEDVSYSPPTEWL